MVAERGRGEGCLAWAKVPFLLSTHWQSLSAKDPQGIRSCQLLQGIQGHDPGAAEMPVPR